MSALLLYINISGRIRIVAKHEQKLQVLSKYYYKYLDFFP
jgi:hypothetical protein